jgi:hyperosmotically inducible periplasmic protein
MTTKIRTLFVCMLLVAGAQACSSSHDNSEQPRAAAENAGDERADAHPVAQNPDNLPAEPHKDVPEVTRPGRLASDVPGVVDPGAPPIVPLDPLPPLQAAPDNTAVNERDRNNQTLTPGDQGSSERDMAITQRIRETVVDDDNLSFTAKNVKIITLEGRVTLRGPVRNDRERRVIEKAAVAVAGQGQVANELEIR